MAEPYKDKKGYLRGDSKHSDLISRQVARSEIYEKERHKYPLLFRYYIVHHVNGEKLDNSVKNLFISSNYYIIFKRELQ